MLERPTPNAFTTSDALLDKLCALRPTAATLYGIPGHDHAWDDLSPAGVDRVASVLYASAAEARALPAPQDGDERLARLVLAEFVASELDRVERQAHLSDLNGIASPVQGLRMAFDSMKKHDRDDWHAVAERLHTLDWACARYRESLEAGVRAGAVVARRQVLAAVRELRIHAGEESYFRSLPAAFASSGIDDPALGARIARGADLARRAFAELGDYLEAQYLPHARVRDAEGPERYAREARRFLGLDIDLRETFAWGIEEMRSIERRMREVGRLVAPEAPSLAAVVELLNHDPARAAPNHEVFVALMAERQARALAELDGKHFEVPALVRKLEVKLAAKGGALGAYYVPPGDDGGRPGTVWYQLGDATTVPLYSEISTAYHEGFPGHHLQCGTQVALRARLSRLHRVAIENYLGYVEGWALYAERLMDELGYYEKPEYLFGMLGQQMMRACRVVLDIGAHLELTLPRDSPFRPGALIDYELGVAMLVDVAGMPRDGAESEMTRYFGWPGQAIAYKVGERAILDLRAEMRRRDGAAFDLRAFHDKLLGTGALGLATMRELMLAS